MTHWPSLALADRNMTATPSPGEKPGEPRTPHGWTKDPPRDFVLVSRRLNPPTGKPVALLAGLKQTGTEAAARLPSDAARITGILKQLPAGWSNKNPQLVLHARVINGSPAAPELVDFYQW